MSEPPPIPGPLGGGTAPSQPLNSSPPGPPGGRSAIPYRPTRRPPMAVLIVCDDGEHDGERIRLRGERFVIGRSEGDLVLPHDDQISGRHAEIVRVADGDEFSWVVTDLGSTNGLFIRVTRTPLRHGTEFLLGWGRYRFQEAQVVRGAVESPASPGRFAATFDGANDEPKTVPPTLVEVVGGGSGNRQALTLREYWIGTDPSCPVRRPGDPFCDPKHARVWREASGQWMVEHQKSLNGLWLRVPHVTATRGCTFQIGEQRFRLLTGDEG